MSTRARIGSMVKKVTPGRLKASSSTTQAPSDSSLSWPPDFSRPVQLPAELEILIFETAVKQYTCTIPALLRLSKRINQILAAIVYETVNLLTYPPVPSRKGRQPESSTYGRYAKHLLMGGSNVLAEDCERILTDCIHVVNLGFWSPLQTKYIIPHLERLNLKKISIELASLVSADFDNPNLWRSVTHIDVTRFLSRTEPQNKSWTDFGRLPSLTHLALNEWLSFNNVQAILDACKNLELLVLIKHHRPPGPESAQWDLAIRAADPQTLEDPRLVLLYFQRYHSDEWFAGVQGKEDFWAVAEAVSAAKRCGDLKGKGGSWIFQGKWRLDLESLRREVRGDSYQHPSALNE